MRRFPLVAAWSLALLPGLLAPGRASVAGDEPTPPAPPAPEQPEPDDPNRGRIGFGIKLAQLLTPADRKEAGITVEKGMVVGVVESNSPAYRAGLKAGDQILKYNGKEVPDSSAVKTDKDEEARKAWEKAWGALGKGVKPGDTVELVVKRGAETLTLKAIAVTREELEDGAKHDQVPEMTGGEPAAVTFDFETLPEGAYRPAGFARFLGLWEVTEEEGKPENHVLAQTSVAEPWAVCFATGPGRVYTDAKVSVRWKPLEGEEDASGGIAFRGSDWKNYYLVRANSLEDNFVIYFVENGLRRDLASVDVTPPKLKKWHTLEVTFEGTKIKAVLNGKDTLELENDLFSKGWCGLWTKADSQTVFDDFKIEPLTSK